MAGGKIVPIIERGDQAVRDDVYAALVAATCAIDAKIAALEHKLDRKIEELIAKRDEEEGVSSPKSLTKENTSRHSLVGAGLHHGMHQRL